MLLSPVSCIGTKELISWHKAQQKKCRNIQPRHQPFPRCDLLCPSNIKVTEDITSLPRSKPGRFVKSINKGIPDSHTRLLYNGKSKTHPGLLCQLRTGIYRLNSYLSKIQTTESGECGCNTREETVHRFLFLLHYGKTSDP